MKTILLDAHEPLGNKTYSAGKMNSSRDSTYLRTFIRRLSLLTLCLIGAASTLAQSVMPIFVTGMVHIDPLPTNVSDSLFVKQVYDSHRNALLWYVNYANQTGLHLSAQMTGVYAEACIRSGHASDFLPFMPGGPHHLGTHLHANVKGPGSYLWRTLLPQFYNHSDSVRRVMIDNIPWVNQVFTANGFLSTDNWFFHGSHAMFRGMDTILFRYPSPNPYPYNNVYRMVGAARGGHYVYRGGFLAEPSVSGDTGYVKFPEVGGIIGYDQVHRPEGMVYGTVPYQRRDFLRVYIEWRESVQRGEPSAVRFFCWMVHPYQLVPSAVGTDGRPPRTHIQELVTWLKDNFVGYTDESGNIVAQFANASEIRSAYEAWRGSYPNYHERLQSALANRQRPLYLPGIFWRLETTYHDSRLAASDINLVIHQLIDRRFSQPVYLVWSKSGNRPLEPSLSGWFRIVHGDSSTQLLYSSAIIVGPQPVVLEPSPPTAVGEQNELLQVYSLEQNYPNPFNPTTTICFTLPQRAYVRLKVYDVLGREVVTLVEGELNPGEHSVIFNAKGLASGVYFYRLNAGTFIQQKKMEAIK